MYPFSFAGLFIYWQLFVSYYVSVTAVGPGSVCEYTFQVQNENITLSLVKGGCESELTVITMDWEKSIHENISNLVQVDELPEYFTLIYNEVSDDPVILGWSLELNTCPPCDYATTLEVFINPLYDLLEKCKPRFINIKSAPEECDSTGHPLGALTLVSASPSPESTRPTVTASSSPFQESTNTVITNASPVQESTTVSANTSPVQESTSVSANTNPVQERTTVYTITRLIQESTTLSATTGPGPINSTVPRKAKQNKCQIDANKDDFANNPGKLAAVAGACSFVAGAAAASTTLCLVLRFCLEVPISIRHRRKKQQELD